MMSEARNALATMQRGCLWWSDSLATLVSCCGDSGQVAGTLHPSRTSYVVGPTSYVGRPTSDVRRPAWGIPKGNETKDSAMFVNMTAMFSKLDAELKTIRESAARARLSVDRTLASCALREAQTAVREERVRGAAEEEWASWTSAQRRAVAELFGPP